MDWSKYSSLKSGSKVSFGKEKQVMREAVSEVQDDDGKVVRAAEAKEEREYVAMSQKRWNACLLYTSPSPRDRQKSRMPSSA